METETKTLGPTLGLEQGLALDPQLSPPHTRSLLPALPPGQWVKYTREGERQRERNTQAERDRTKTETEESREMKRETERHKERQKE